MSQAAAEKTQQLGVSQEPGARIVWSFSLHCLASGMGSLKGLDRSAYMWLLHVASASYMAILGD